MRCEKYSELPFNHCDDSCPSPRMALALIEYHAPLYFVVILTKVHEVTRRCDSHDTVSFKKIEKYSEARYW